MLISGNHVAYTVPYGVSPRIKLLHSIESKYFSRKWPNYARVIMEASSDAGGERNFKPENLEWFYHIFTLLSSHMLTFGKQCFIGLYWVVFTPGSSPERIRSTTGMSKN